MADKDKPVLSPYLRQHTGNPVKWQVWGEQALARAKAENKPIFLSIGYSTNYWCHVMARDVFSRPDVAALMNAWFINIKVDREERPEIDEIYMVARQLMTKEASWPNNVFLTPDLEPFYAVGTMAADDRYGEWNFVKIITSLHEGWMNRRDEVLASARKVREGVVHFLHENRENYPAVPLSVALSDRLLSLLKEQEDKVNGGFFSSPKFPQEHFLLYLLKHAKRTGNEEALGLATRALERMAAGGISDHIGGGFHRYAVDAEWRVPHFEKMLFTQALCARAYEELYGFTQDPYHRDVAENILGFVRTHLTDTNGAFYSAIDAETQFVEGAYYAWEERELQEALSPSELTFFRSVYGEQDIPLFPGHEPVAGKAIYARSPLPKCASELSLSYAELKDKLKPVLAKLDAYRAKHHELPHKDTKIIVAWNGLMIDAFALAGQAFGKPEYIEYADRAAKYLLKHARLSDGRLARMVMDGVAQDDAYLEDYAFLVDGLLSLYRATHQPHYLEEAKALLAQADELFFDAENHCYFYTDGEEHLIVRIKLAADNALPSPTAVMVHNALDLYEITKEKNWLDRASEILNHYSGHMEKLPADYCTMIHALLRYLYVSEAS